jgi:hypothetical protein
LSAIFKPTALRIVALYRLPDRGEPSELILDVLARTQGTQQLGLDLEDGDLVGELAP